MTIRECGLGLLLIKVGSDSHARQTATIISRIEKVFERESPDCAIVHKIGKENPILFPCHPWTRQRIADFGLLDLFFDCLSTNGPVETGICLLEPLDYNDFLYLWKDAACVLTDSGGLQEETTALGIPCLTLRENTERPITLEHGTNRLAGNTKEDILKAYRACAQDDPSRYQIPPLWDGRACERIVKTLEGGDEG